MQFQEIIAQKKFEKIKRENEALHCIEKFPLLTHLLSKDIHHIKEQSSIF